MHAGQAQSQLPYYIQSPACGLNLETAPERSLNSSLSLKRVAKAGIYIFRGPIDTSDHILADDLVKLVKSIDEPHLASPHLCCALSLSSYIHASAALLHIKDSDSILLQLESLWLRKLSQYWPSAAVLTEKINFLITSFALFETTDEHSRTIEERKQMILDAASQFGLSDL